MGAVLHAFFANRIVQGALTGALAAAAVDFQAFKSWKSWDEAVHYQWGTAIFRWCQGAAIGAAGALGIGALV